MTWLDLEVISQGHTWVHVCGIHVNIGTLKSNVLSTRALISERRWGTWILKSLTVDRETTRPLDDWFCALSTLYLLRGCNAFSLVEKLQSHWMIGSVLCQPCTCSGAVMRSHWSRNYKALDDWFCALSALYVLRGSNAFWLVEKLWWYW